MLVRRFRTTSAFALAAALSACGGGGSSGASGSGVTAVTPTPTPAPPAPTPTPSATYIVEAISPVVASISFYPGGVVASGADAATWYTNIAGVFTFGQTDSVIRASSGNARISDYRAIHALSAFGYDKATRTYLILAAPAGATTVSPITSLIYYSGSESAVRSSLGMAPGGSYPLSADIDLKTYSATREGNGAVLGAYIRTILLGIAISVEPGAQAEPIYALGARALPDFIKANPSLDLFSAEGCERLLRAFWGTRYNAATYRAAAHLVRTYAEAIRAVHTDPSAAPLYLHGVSGVLYPAIERLLNANSPDAAARALSLTPADFSRALAPFADGLAFPASLFVPDPDYVRLAPGGEVTLARFGNEGIANSYYGDFAFWVGPTQYGITSDQNELISVAVPAAYAGAIEAEIVETNRIRIRAKPGFVGIARMDYITRFAFDARRETGQIWVNVE